MKAKTGTREWAETNVNIQIGCEHNCRYCYAREILVRTGHCAAADWGKPKINQSKVNQNRRYIDGRVMFPSSHDITPLNLSECLCVLNRLLDAGNEVLIVSKPHWRCITTICERFLDHKKQILFRFTIGSLCDNVLKFWEPGAPNLDERLSCLRYAYESGYQTSVSAEPFLDGTVKVLYLGVKDLITESFWIGKVNKLDQRGIFDDCEIAAINRYVYLCQAFQTDMEILKLYNDLKDEPLVKFKDSIREVIEKCGI
jgi:hypothetical protein